MINFFKNLFKLPKGSVLDTASELSVEFLITKRDLIKIKSDFLFDWWNSNKKTASTLIVWQKHFELEQKIMKLNRAINALIINH